MGSRFAAEHEVLPHKPPFPRPATRPRVSAKTNSTLPLPAHKGCSVVLWLWQISTDNSLTWKLNLCTVHDNRDVFFFSQRVETVETWRGGNGCCQIHSPCCLAWCHPMQASGGHFVRVQVSGLKMRSESARIRRSSGDVAACLQALAGCEAKAGRCFRGRMQLSTPQAAEAERWKDWEYFPFMCLPGCSGHRWKQRSDKLESAQSSLTLAISCEDGRISREDKTQEGSQRRENDAHPHCLINITVVEAARYNPQWHFTERQKLKKLSPARFGNSTAQDRRALQLLVKIAQRISGTAPPALEDRSWDQEHLLLKKNIQSHSINLYSFIAVLVTCSVAGGQRVQNNDSQRK